MPRRVQRVHSPHKEWIRTGFRLIGWGVFLLVPIIGTYADFLRGNFAPEILRLLAGNCYAWVFVSLIVAGILMLFFYFDLKSLRFRAITSRNAIWNFKNIVFLFTFIPVFGMLIAFLFAFGLMDTITQIDPYFLFWARLFHTGSGDFAFSFPSLIFFLFFYVINMFLATYLGYGRWVRMGLRLSSHHSHYWHPMPYDNDYSSSSNDDYDDYDDYYDSLSHYDDYYD